MRKTMYVMPLSGSRRKAMRSEFRNIESFFARDAETEENRLAY